MKRQLWNWPDMWVIALVTCACGFTFFQVLSSPVVMDMMVSWNGKTQTALKDLDLISEQFLRVTVLQRFKAMDVNASNEYWARSTWNFQTPNKRSQLTKRVWWRFVASSELSLACVSFYCIPELQTQGSWIFLLITPHYISYYKTAWSLFNHTKNSTDFRESCVNQRMNRQRQCIFIFKSRKQPSILHESKLNSQKRGSTTIILGICTQR